MALIANAYILSHPTSCSRLKLVSLGYLWRRDQSELFKEMIDSDITSILIKVAALGLDKRHLGQTLGQMRDHLEKKVACIFTNAWNYLTN